MASGGGGGGGGNWIGGLVGGISAGAGVRGYNQQVNKSNQYYGQTYNPNNVNAYAQAFNPWIWDAINGKQGNTQFSKDLYNIIQGKDISPYLLNRPLNQINQGANQNLAQFQSLVGRNNAGGGLANAYGLANIGGRNTAIANLMNQYGQWRENQRRSDINWGFGQLGQSQDRGQGTVDRIAQSHQFKKNFWQKLGAFGAGYASGSGEGGAAPQAPSNQTPAPYYLGGTNYTPASETSGNWVGGPNYGQGSSYGQGPMVGPSNNPYPGSTSSIQTGNNTPNWWGN